MYRAADDFAVLEDALISSITWWGGSANGKHIAVDSIDQVLAFAIEIYESNDEDTQPGKRLTRIIVPFDRIHTQRTSLELFARSDIFRHSATLPEPLPVSAEKRYWLCIGAYLSGPPMWVWCRGAKANRKAAIDFGVDGTWGDEPDAPAWKSYLDLAFELHAPGADDAFQEVDDRALDALIRQLGDEDFRARDIAEKTLIKIGADAVPRLRAHQRDDDSEVQSRVKRILALLGASSKRRPQLPLHVIAEGEDLSTIAQRHSVSIEALMRTNALHTQAVRPGEMLKIR